jgi:hypothetical protein
VAEIAKPSITWIPWSEGCGLLIERYSSTDLTTAYLRTNLRLGKWHALDRCVVADGSVVETILLSSFWSVAELYGMKTKAAVAITAPGGYRTWTTLPWPRAGGHHLFLCREEIDPQSDNSPAEALTPEQWVHTELQTLLKEGRVRKGHGAVSAATELLEQRIEAAVRNGQCTKSIEHGTLRNYVSRSLRNC